MNILDISYLLLRVMGSSIWRSLSKSWILRTYSSAIIHLTIYMCCEIGLEVWVMSVWSSLSMIKYKRTLVILRNTVRAFVVVLFPLFCKATERLCFIIVFWWWWACWRSCRPVIISHHWSLRVIELRTIEGISYD